MKKLLALLFVCAGLTAMAVTPHSIKTVNRAKQSVENLSKANTFANELIKPVMNKVKVSDAQGSLHEFVRTHDLKQNNLMRRAPRRLAQEDFVTDWIVSNIEFVDSAGVWQPAYFAGGTTTWEIDTFVEALNVTRYDINNAFLLTDPDGDETAFTDPYYYFPVYFEAWWEYNIGFIEGGMQAAYFVNQVKTGSTTSTTTYRETYWYPFIVDEAFYTGASDTIADEVMFVEIDDSGILYSSEKFGVIHAYVHHNVTYNNRTGNVTRDVFVDSVMVKSGLYGSNYFVMPNASHEYTVATETEEETPGGDVVYSLGSTYTDPVLAYQNETNDSIFFWNMWGLAYRDAFMTIDSERLMTFPLQVVHTANVDKYNDYYAQQGYVFSENYLNFPVEYDFDNDTIISTGWNPTPVEVNSELNKITWGGNQILDFFEIPNDPDYAGYRIMGVGYIPFLRNSITLNFALTLPQPAETWQLGDVNHDGEVDVADVALMIKVALGQDYDVFYWEEANLDDDPDNVDIGDVSALINIVLGKE